MLAELVGLSGSGRAAGNFLGQLAKAILDRCRYHGEEGDADDLPSPSGCDWMCRRRRWWAYERFTRSNAPEPARGLVN
jgi:hypothetical protein